MADNITPPPGYTIGSDAAPPAPSITPPPGYTLGSDSATDDPKNWTPEQLAAQKAKSQDPNVKYAPTTGGETGLTGVVVGAGKSAAGLVSGAARLVNKGINTVLPDSMQLPLPDKVPETKGLAEGVGGAIEQGIEFAGGEAGLKGIASIAKIGKYAPEVMDLLQKYPTASKIILGALKGGAVGGAQGAAHGEAGKEGALKGAEAGATGGVIGGTVAEAAPEVLPKIAKMLGVGGQDFESAMAKAGRPAISERNWKDSLDLAKPAILDNIDPKSVKTIDDFVDQVGTIKNDLWTKKIEPQIARNAAVPVTTTPIAAEIRSGITRSLKKHFPEEASQMEQMANNFVGNSTIGDLSEDLETFNAKLKSYYKMDPQARAASGKTDGDIAGLERASAGMRDLLFNELEARGEQIPAQLRKQYGALADVERVFTKRIPVADRQGPMNLSQILALAGGAGEAAGAIASGHPMAAVAGAVPVAVATAAKMRNDPASLIRQGINAATESGPVAKVAGQVAKTATTAAGAQAARALLPHHGGNDWVKMTMPDGKTIVEVHPEDEAEATKRGLTAVQ